MSDTRRPDSPDTADSWLTTGEVRALVAAAGGSQCAQTVRRRAGSEWDIEVVRSGARGDRRYRESDVRRYIAQLQKQRKK